MDIEGASLKAFSYSCNESTGNRRSRSFDGCSVRAVADERDGERGNMAAWRQCVYGNRADDDV